MKHIILCADDYGQNTAISQAIIELIKENRLFATSCITSSYYWLTHAKWLEPFKDTLDLGLHFNLTEGKPVSKEFGIEFNSLPQLIIKAYSKRLNLAAIERECHAQLDQFIAGIGREPDFVDGHQHIHQLPIIREAVLNVYEKRLRKIGTYLRCVDDPSAVWRVNQSAYIKRILIQLCGASAFKKALVTRQIPHNSSFSGIYNFAAAKKYATFFPRFLKQIQDKGIIMCHPGLGTITEEDAIASARYEEYQYFRSAPFKTLCEAELVTIGRFKNVNEP